MKLHRAPASLVPPSVADARGKAFGATMARALAEPDFEQLLFERIDNVAADLLPFLVREFSIEDFVEPDMRIDVVRALLKASYAIHARTGYIDAVRDGLARIGMPVVGWEQWFEAQPKREPGTHRIRIAVGGHLFSGQTALIDQRLHMLARRMVESLKRYSQDIEIVFVAGVQGAAGVASRGQAAQYASGIIRAAPRRLTPMRAGVASRGQAAQLATGLMRATPFAAPNVAASAAQMRGRVIDKRDYWPAPAPGRVLRKWFASAGVGEWLRQDFVDAGLSPWGHPAFYLEERDVSYGRSILLNRWLMHRRPDAVEEWGDVLPIGSPYEAVPQFKTLVFAGGCGIIWGGKLRAGDVARQPIATDALRTTPTPQVAYPWDQGYQTLKVSEVYPYYLHQGRAYLDVIRVDIRQAFYLDWSLSPSNAVNYDVSYLFAAGLGMIDQSVVVNGAPSGGRSMTRYAWSDI